nr:MAG TPA: hypothetical protein [Caudoviricetes sp.]
MIEFKRAGDVMVFECQAFTIEVCADSERIAIREEASNDPRVKEVITDAFEVLDMMLEHKDRNTNVVKADSCINHERKRLMEFMKRRGL